MSLYNYKSLFNTKSHLYKDIFNAFLPYENCSQIKSGMVKDEPIHYFWYPGGMSPGRTYV